MTPMQYNFSFFHLLFFNQWVVSSFFFAFQQQVDDDVDHYPESDVGCQQQHDPQIVSQHHIGQGEQSFDDDAFLP